MIFEIPKKHQQSRFEVPLEGFSEMRFGRVIMYGIICIGRSSRRCGVGVRGGLQRAEWPLERTDSEDEKIVNMMLYYSLCNLSDEGLVTRWQENPYGQNFIAVKMIQKRRWWAISNQTIGWTNTPQLFLYPGSRCGSDALRMWYLIL